MTKGGWITKYAFADNALSNDADGHSAMEDGYLSADAEGRAKMAASFINADKIADGAVTLAKLSSAKMLYTGVYGYAAYGAAVYG